jgi:hypothetical protein
MYSDYIKEHGKHETVPKYFTELTGKENKILFKKPARKLRDGKREIWYEAKERMKK